MYFKSILHIFYFYIHTLYFDVIYIYVYLFHLSFIFTFLSMLYLSISGFDLHFVIQVTTAAQLHWKEFEINFSACSHPALSLSLVYNDENLRQWFWLKTKLNPFHITGFSISSEHISKTKDFLFSGGKERDYSIKWINALLTVNHSSKQFLYHYR